MLKFAARLTFKAASVRRPLEVGAFDVLIAGRQRARWRILGLLALWGGDWNDYWPSPNFKGGQAHGDAVNDDLDLVLRNWHAVDEDSGLLGYGGLLGDWSLLGGRRGDSSGFLLPLLALLILSVVHAAAADQAENQEEPPRQASLGVTSAGAAVLVVVGGPRGAGGGGGTAAGRLHCGAPGAADAGVGVDVLVAAVVDDVAAFHAGGVLDGAADALAAVHDAGGQLVANRQRELRIRARGARHRREPATGCKCCGEKDGDEEKELHGWNTSGG
jgi:hypothetical protein